MANFTAKDVNELRKSTGVGMMDCKKALTEADGDVEKAIELLREKGLATQAKKAGRVAASRPRRLRSRRIFWQMQPPSSMAALRRRHPPSPIPSP